MAVNKLASGRTALRQTKQGRPLSVKQIIHSAEQFYE
jgi:hypothetical protein